MGELDGQGEGSGPEEVPSTMRIGADGVRFREFRPGDEEQIVALRDAAFGGFYPGLKPVDKMDYMRWFTEPHESHRTRTTVAEIGGRIASSLGSVNRAIKVGQRTLPLRTGGVGGATHPDFQRRRIFGACGVPLLDEAASSMYSCVRPPRIARLPTRRCEREVFATNVRCAASRTGYSPV